MLSLDGFPQDEVLNADNEHATISVTQEMVDLYGRIKKQGLKVEAVAEIMGLTTNQLRHVQTFYDRQVMAKEIEKQNHEKLKKKRDVATAKIRSVGWAPPKPKEGNLVKPPRIIRIDGRSLTGRFAGDPLPGQSVLHKRKAANVPLVPLLERLNEERRKVTQNREIKQMQKLLDLN